MNIYQGMYVKYTGTSLPSLQDKIGIIISSNPLEEVSIRFRPNVIHNISVDLLVKATRSEILDDILEASSIYFDHADIRESSLAEKIIRIITIQREINQTIFEKTKVYLEGVLRDIISTLPIAWKSGIYILKGFSPDISSIVMACRFGANIFLIDLQMQTSLKRLIWMNGKFVTEEDAIKFAGKNKLPLRREIKRNTYHV